MAPTTSNVSPTNDTAISGTLTKTLFSLDAAEEVMLIAEEYNLLNKPPSEESLSAESAKYNGEAVGLAVVILVYPQYNNYKRRELIVYLKISIVTII